MSSNSFYTKNPHLPTRLEYFYLIRRKTTNRFYARSKYALTQYIHPNQFWNSDHKFPYYTKSKIINKLRLEGGNDAFEICFISPRPNNDAREFESLFLNCIDAASDLNWLNKSNGSEKFRCDTKPHSDDTKIKIGLSSKGRIVSNETRIKMSKARLGVPKSQETKINMSNAFKGRTFSDEHRKNLSIVQLGKSHEKLTCPHCKLIGGKANMKRYHFDNCKF